MLTENAKVLKKYKTQKNRGSFLKSILTPGGKAFLPASFLTINLLSDFKEL